MTKDEIKDIIELNYDYNLDWLVDYFYKIYQDKNRYEEALKTSRLLLENTVSKKRYNDLVKKYNKEVKKRWIIIYN